MQPQGMHLDFNAIAKGYAVDRLVVMMDEKGVPDYLLEVGGELRTLGIEQDQRATMVGGHRRSPDNARPKN